MDITIFPVFKSFELNFNNLTDFNGLIFRIQIS